MATNNQKSCFVIMPISDTTGYDAGHFERVYEYIIQPACKEAGFKPYRADETKNTNVIVIDILKRIINSDMCICDLSSKNPNVLYELGIRQAFNLPVTLIKDNITNRIFDIQYIRDIEYQKDLRVDQIKKSIIDIAASLKTTFEQRDRKDNSLIQLLNVQPAELKNEVNLSPEITFLKEILGGINEKIVELDDKISRLDVVSTKVSIEQFDNRLKIAEKLIEDVEFLKTKSAPE